MAALMEAPLDTTQMDDEEQLEEMEEEEAGAAFFHVTELENLGISRQDTQKLAAGGFCTVQSVAYATIKKLCEVKGISDTKAQKLREISYKLVPSTFVGVVARGASIMAAIVSVACGA